MTIANPKRLFDTFRRMLGRGLTQEEVDGLNAAIDDKPEGLQVSLVGLANIKRWESCRLTAYPDPGTGGDPWTIGWGATGPGIVRGLTWTQAQADARLAEDVERFAEQVRVALGDAPATQGQFDAMVSLAYNIGSRAFASSTLLKLHKAGDYAGAAAQFGKWVNAGGRRMAGLVNRRAAEAAIYRGRA